MSWHPWYDACEALTSASSALETNLTMQTLSATLITQSKRPAMNYLALGDDIYFLRNGALHCRSEVKPLRLMMTDLTMTAWSIMLTCNTTCLKLRH